MPEEKTEKAQIIDRVDSKDLENKLDTNTAIEKREVLLFLSRFSKLSIAIFTIIVLTFLYFFVIPPIDSFDTPKMIKIDSGDSLKSISNNIKKEKIIKSSNLLRLTISLFGGQNKIKAGVYKFYKPTSIINASYRLLHEDYGYQPVKITFPEGMNSMDMIKLIESKFPNVLEEGIEARQKFIEKEGRLFPETYFFPPGTDLETIAERMTEEYEKKIDKFREDIKSSGHTEDEILTMASILEEEVRGKEEKAKVADLLWRRLEKGMLLQVDSTLGYINGKTSLQLTMKDLATSSPYNTYKNKGLPPAPISNPGLGAIESALFPVKNNYLFFLTDKEGVAHFSKTYAEHLRFREIYIR